MNKKNNKIFEKVLFNITNEVEEYIKNNYGYIRRAKIEKYIISKILKDKSFHDEELIVLKHRIYKIISRTISKYKTICKNGTNSKYKLRKLHRRETIYHVYNFYNNYYTAINYSDYLNKKTNLAKYFQNINIGLGWNSREILISALDSYSTETGVKYNLNKLSEEKDKSVEIFKKNYVSLLNNLKNKTKTINNIFISKIHKTLFKNIYKFNGKYKVVENNLSFGFWLCDPIQVEFEIELWCEYFKIKPKTINDAIIRSGIQHLWFESIHPFPDGNGRIGRFLIGYYFYYHNYLSVPFEFFHSILKNSEKKYKEELKKSQLNDDWEKFLNYWKEMIDSF